MAKYWKNLEYHEDTVEKHKITEDEIRFLKELQKEMNTQDNLGQADPRYWVIRDFGKVYGERLNNPDGFTVFDSDGGSEVCEIEYRIFRTSEMADEILKKLEEQDYDLSDDDKQTIEDAYDLDSLIEALEELDFSVVQYEIVPKYSGMFLTQKAAEEHLRKNYYHYTDDATTYAMTAWRSQEVDMLYKILHSVDFDLLDTLYDLVEKETATTHDIEGDGYYKGELVYDTWICPRCGTRYEIGYDEYEYCPKCGQHIDLDSLEQECEDAEDEE